MQDLMQEVELLSENQEVLTGMVVNKTDMQREAPKKYQEMVFEELKYLEERMAREVLELVQKKHVLIKWEGQRERVIILQILGGSRAIQHRNDVRDIVSVESCSSLACDRKKCARSLRGRCKARRSFVDRGWKRERKRGLDGGTGSGKA